MFVRREVVFIRGKNDVNDWEEAKNRKRKGERHRASIRRKDKEGNHDEERERKQ